MISYIILLVSFALFLMTVTRNKVFVKNHIILTSIVSALFGSYSIAYFIADHFTGKGIDDSVIYHLKYGLVGAGYQEYWVLIVLSCAAVSVCALLPVIVTIGQTESTRAMSVGRKMVVLFLLLSALALNPTTHNLTKFFQSNAISELNVDFGKYYRSPEISQKSQKLNVIYIYAESLERTYFNEDVFPGLIKELRHLESIGTSFTNIKQVAKTEWTIAGLTASQCGIPLVTPSHGNSMSGVDRFLPNAKCLGDLLSEQNYNLVYLSGSSLEFAGVGQLFSSHSFNTVSGLVELHSNLSNPTYQNSWGLYDDSLLEIALKEINKLSSQDKPFGLFLSTMDTHFPNGNPSKSCEGKKYRSGKNPMLNAVVCTDYLLGRFVKTILASEYAKNIIIVISSDHLSMPNAATNTLDTLERRNLFLVIEPDRQQHRINKEGSMLDVAPTLLSYLGFTGEVGLGRNLRGDEQSIISMFPFNEVLKSWEKPMNLFWGFPKVGREDVFTINAINKTVSVEQRVFSYPLLIEFESNNDTTIRFQFSASPGHDLLIDHIARLEPSKPFLWVDKCEAIRTEFFESMQKYCVVFGRAATRALVYSEIRKIGEVKVNDIYDAVLNAKIPARDSTRTERQVNADGHNRNRFIAHAGGMIGTSVYTNSLEALSLNYEKGFRLFELDIIESSDGVYVAEHDWKHWKSIINGYTGALPPSRATFKKYQKYGKYTPLDIDDINQWFKTHPDAVLVTDKVNTPRDFSEKFIDKNRLVMELFSMSALREGLKSGIKSAMPTWDVITGMSGDKVQALLEMGVTDVAASRNIIASNKRLLSDLKNNGIRVYVFHVNFEEEKDEGYVVCKDMDYIYGLYSDKYDFRSDVNCKQYEPVSYWYRRRNN